MKKPDKEFIWLAIETVFVIIVVIIIDIIFEIGVWLWETVKRMWLHDYRRNN